MKYAITNLQTIKDGQNIPGFDGDLSIEIAAGISTVTFDDTEWGLRVTQQFVADSNDAMTNIMSAVIGFVKYAASYNKNYFDAVTFTTKGE